MKHFNALTRVRQEEKEALTILSSSGGWLLIATSAFFISLAISVTG